MLPPHDHLGASHNTRQWGTLEMLSLVVYGEKVGMDIELLQSLSVWVTKISQP